MLWRKSVFFVVKIICFDCYVELLNQKTEEIERMMNEKKTLIADILQIPLHDYDTITEVCLHYLSFSFPHGGSGNQTSLGSSTGILGIASFEIWRLGHISHQAWWEIWDVSVKFHNCSSIYGWLIKLSQKIQNGGCRYHDLLFGNAGPPTKSSSWLEGCVKISCQSLNYFER